jgi:hypothetical protein
MSIEPKKVYIQFVNSNDEKITVPMVVVQNPIGELWYDKLKAFVNMSDPWVETRWSGFNLKRRELPILIEKLERCIKTINDSWLNKEYGYYIDVDKIPLDYPTELHNTIHHHFEILMGQSWKPSIWYDRIVNERGDDVVFSAVRGLNDLSHEIEEKKVNNPFPHLHFIFNNQHGPVAATELPDEVEDYFELGNTEGAIYLTYAQLGKTWLEVVYDNDDKIFEENITPHRLITGAFSMCFKGDSVTKEQHIQFLAERLKKFGKHPSDKSLRLGRVPVAYMEYDNLSNLSSTLEDYDQVYSLSVEEKTITFPPYDDGY